jgi:hypothetical protein
MALKKHLSPLSEIRGYRQPMERYFDGYPSTALHVLDFADRAALTNGDLDINLDQLWATNFTSTDGRVTAELSPETLADIYASLRKGHAEHLSQVEEIFAIGPNGVQREEAEFGIVIGEQPTATFAELVADDVDLHPAQVSPDLAGSVADFHRYSEAHERFHVVNNAKWASPSAWSDRHRNAHGAEGLKALNDKMRFCHRNEPYVEFLDECVADVGAMLYHLRDGGDENYLDTVADVRALGARSGVSDMEHFTTPCLDELVGRLSVMRNMGVMQNLSIDQMHNMACRLVAQSAPDRTHFYLLERATRDAGTPAREVRRYDAIFDRDPQLQARATPELMADLKRTYDSRLAEARQNIHLPNEKARAQFTNDDLIRAQEEELLRFQVTEYPDFEGPQGERYLLTAKLRQLDLDPEGDPTRRAVLARMIETRGTPEPDPTPDRDEVAR